MVDKKNEVYTNIWNEGVLREINNPPCSLGRSKHRWNPLAFKVDDGSISYCQFCYVERAKVFDRGSKQLVSRYYPHETWFRLVSQSKKIIVEETDD